MILLLTLIGRFADNTASLMTPQTSLSDVLVSRPRRACYMYPVARQAATPDDSEKSLRSEERPNSSLSLLGRAA